MRGSASTRVAAPPVVSSEGFKSVMPSDCSDPELLRREEQSIIEKVLGGEPNQFTRLVERYQSRVFVLIVRQVPSTAIAQELTQESFLRAYSRLDSFRFECKFSTWLTRIALNVTSSYLSSRSHRDSQATMPMDESVEQRSPAPAELDRFDDGAARRFKEMIVTLTPKLREVFVLCAVEQWSYAEVADLLQIPIGTVRSRLNTARLTLQRLYFEGDI